MKKTLMYTLLLALTPAAFAAEPSFKDMKELEAVNGYMLYGSDYDDLDKAEFYQTQCAEQTVRKMDLKKKVIGEPVPFSKLNGVTKAAAGVSCLVEAGQKEAIENAKK